MCILSLEYGKQVIDTLNTWEALKVKKNSLLSKLHKSSTQKILSNEEMQSTKQKIQGFECGKSTKDKVTNTINRRKRLMAKGGELKLV